MMEQYLYEIFASHDNKNVNAGLLSFDAMWTHGQIPTFRRNIPHHLEDGGGKFLKNGGVHDITMNSTVRIYICFDNIKKYIFDH